MYVDKEQRIGVMSIGFLLEDLDDAVVWRGPKKNGRSCAVYTKYRMGEVHLI